MHIPLPCMTIYFYYEIIVFFYEFYIFQSLSEHLFLKPVKCAHSFECIINLSLYNSPFPNGLCQMHFVFDVLIVKLLIDLHKHHSRIDILFGYDIERWCNLQLIPVALQITIVTLFLLVLKTTYPHPKKKKTTLISFKKLIYVCQLLNAAKISL